MKIKFLIMLMVITTMTAKADINRLISSLGNMTDYSSTVSFEVSLPMAANDEVHYDVDITSVASPTDTLSPVVYLIDWSLDTPTGKSIGFSSYFDGNLYRYREGSRLQEYHASSNPAPFLTTIPVNKSVQFYDLLPVAMATEIERMVADTTFTLTWTPDTIYRGQPAAVLKALQVVRGIEAAELLYVFEQNSLHPIYVNKEMSPGSISEQTLSYTYSEPKKSIIPPVDEEELIDLYPSVFSQFREGSYGLTSLKGHVLPGFSLPTLNGERYSHSRGERMSAPSIIAFVDENVSSTLQVIKDVRQALASLPMNVDVYWVFLSNRRDEIENVIGKAQSGENILVSGKNVTKDFGVTDTPAFIFVDNAGNVVETLSGFNKDLREIVINKMSLVK